VTLDRLRVYADLAEMAGNGPMILAYSGGKDSDVLLACAKEAGIEYEAVHHYTTIDPPELVAHVRTHPEVRIERPKRSMYQLIRKKGLPSAHRRWCCQKLKEKTYPGRIVATGVRWAESSRRGKWMMVGHHYRCKTQTLIHPIIDWRLADVWGYLRSRGVNTCELYAEGWKRLGCVCCPLGRRGAVEAERWPKIAAGMRRAFDRYCEDHPGRMDEGGGPDGAWSMFLSGDLGRKSHLSVGCPLFADVRDGEEDSP